MANSLCPVWIARSNNKLSWQRIVGYGSLWLWILMMFNSITLYSNSTNVRESLYIMQIISLVAVIFIMLFMVIIVRPNDIFAKNRALLIASCISMIFGTILAFFSDSQTATGMLILGLASILTGVGSGALFLFWSQIFFRIGGKLALAELAIGSAIGFFISLLLNLTPALFAMICTTLFAIVATVLASRCCKELYDTPQDKFKLIRDKTTPALSPQTIVLFSKALVGAGFIGAIEGFYDVTSGFRTFAMNDTYGAYLLVAGLIAILIMALIALFFSHDSIFYTYRFSILVLCLGCLTTPFLGDNQSYVTVLIFAGYTCFGVVLFTICLDISTSYVINPVRSVGLGFVALYGGEFLGELAAHGMNAATMSVPDLTVVTLGAVAILLIAHLFLFTETDLIKIGIGENNVLENVGCFVPKKTTQGEGAEGTVSARINETETAANKLSAMGVLADGATLGTNATDAAGTTDVVSPSGACTAARQASSGANLGTEAGSDSEFDSGSAPEPKSALGSDETTVPEPLAPSDPAAIIAERYGLSPRESDVLPLLLEGRTIVRIQETLFISAGTVSTHIRHIYQKTGQANRQELIDLAKAITESECTGDNHVEK